MIQNLSVLDWITGHMWWLKSMDHGLNSENISGNRRGRKDCWHLPREEPTFTPTSHTGEVTGWYLDLRPVAFHLKPYRTATEKGWVAAPFAFRWWTPTFDA